MKGCLIIILRWRYFEFGIKLICHEMTNECSIIDKNTFKSSSISARLIKIRLANFNEVLNLN